MATLDENNILLELCMKLRNADIFTITQRGVTTTTKTGTYTNATSDTINVSNVKNIRSIVVASITLTYGQDYTIDLDSSSTCVITYIAAQNGAYTITYDYGTDKIWNEYPREDLTLTSFPRIGMGILSIQSDNGGFGNVNLNRYDISIVTYEANKENLANYTKAIRTWIINNQNNFYYLKLVKPKLQGPIIPGPFEKVKNKIFQQNLDIMSSLNLEIN